MATVTSSSNSSSNSSSVEGGGGGGGGYHIPPDVDRDEYLRTRVIIGREQVVNTAPPELTAAYGRDDKTAELSSGAGVRFIFQRISKNSMSFDLVGVDTSIANALRRIILAEVPTMAIEKVYIETNTGVMQDEVLAHRLGLIPVAADAEDFAELRPGEEMTDANALLFRLNVVAEQGGDDRDHWRRKGSKEVLAEEIEWVPFGKQEKEGKQVGIVSGGVVITKLAVGQEIRLVAYAVRGKGRDHAKFSPVGTASYRLMPDIRILRPVTGQDARDLQKCFAKGVIGIENDAAVVLDPRRDTVSREVFRHPHLKDTVALSRIRDHFIFTVESTGVLAPHLIVLRSLRILGRKCQALLDCHARLTADPNNSTSSSST